MSGGSPIRSSSRYANGLRPERRKAMRAAISPRRQFPEGWPGGQPDKIQ